MRITSPDSRVASPVSAPATSNETAAASARRRQRPDSIARGTDRRVIRQALTRTENNISSAAKLLGPQKINVPGDIRLYCLYGADGTPMSISASFEAAFAAAREHELTPVTVH